MKTFDQQKISNFIISILLPFLAFIAAIERGCMYRSTKEILALVIWGLGILIFLGIKKINIPPKTFTVCWLSFWLWGILSILTTVSPDSTIRWMSSTGAIVILALLTYATIQEPLKLFYRFMFIGALIIVLMGYTFLIIAKAGYITGSHIMQLHFISTFFWKNPAGSYLALFIPIGFGLTCSESNKAWKIFYIIFTILAFSALLLTRSRGAMISLFAAIVISSPFLIKQVLRNWSKIVLIVVIGFALSSTIIPPSWLVARFKKLEEVPQEQAEDPIQERKLMMRMGSRIIADRPILGVGAGAFLSVYSSYLENSHYLSKHLHNQYLQFAAEGGLPVAIFFFVALISSIWLIFRKSKQEKDILLWSIGVGTLAYAVHMTLDFNWELWGTSIPFVFFLMVGLRKSSRDFSIKSGSIIKYSLIIISVIGFIITGIISQSTLYFNSSEIQSQPEERITYLKRAINLYPFSARFHHELGLKYKLNGKFDIARKEFEKVLELEPENIDALYSLGFLLWHTDSTMAHEYINRALDRAPYVLPREQLKAAKRFLNLSDTTKAKEILLSITKCFSTNPRTPYSEGTTGYRYIVARAMFLLSNIYTVQNKVTEAEELFEKAQILGCPRYFDRLAYQWGIKTPAPEWIVMEFIEATTMNDTSLVKKLLADTSEYWQMDQELYLTQIYDVQITMIQGKAIVDALVMVCKDSEVNWNLWFFKLVLTDEGWKITF